MFDFINYSVAENIATIELNRPEVYNALHAGILKELKTAVDMCAQDNSVRAVIISGGSCKAFSSGADLKSGLSDPDLGKVLKATYKPLIVAMQALPKPIICKLNGLAAGAGMSIVLAADMVIANQETYMSELFVGIGLVPDAGALYFLPRIIGTQKTFELCATGRKVFMPEALSMGLVNQIVPAELLDETVLKMAKTLASSATLSIGHMKKVLQASFSSSLEQIIDLEADAQTLCGQSKDFMEGVSAFMMKRTPEFKGE